MHILKSRIFDLQFFGGEGASGGGDGGSTGSATGVSAGEGAAVDAGQQEGRSLESLGVPKALAEKHRAHKSAMQAKSSAENIEEVPPEPQPGAQQAAAAEAETEGSQVRDYDAEWKKVLDEPEFNRRMQDTVNKRLAKTKGIVDTLEPALDLLAKNLGVQHGDYKALADKIVNDPSYYSEDASNMGVDDETAMNVVKREQAAQKKIDEADQTMQEIKLRQHFDSIQRQAADLKQRFPWFDLQKEFQNERFVKMTSPEGGLSVEDAFYAIHHRDVEQMRISERQQAVNETAQKTKTALSNSIQAGRQMPSENGTTTKAATQIMPKLYSEMTREERAEYKRKLQGH